MQKIYPFELDSITLAQRMEEMVSATFADIQSEFLLLPQGDHYITYTQFQGAYEVLKRHSQGFTDLTLNNAWAAVCEDGLVFVVIRVMVGVSPPEWADLARERCRINLPMGAARTLDVRARHINPVSGRRDGFARMGEGKVAQVRSRALLEAAVLSIGDGAPTIKAPNTLHRLAKVDTEFGLESLRHVANQHVPYAMLLYEGYVCVKCWPGLIVKGRKEEFRRSRHEIRRLPRVAVPGRRTDTVPTPAGD